MKKIFFDILEAIIFVLVLGLVSRILKHYMIDFSFWFVIVILFVWVIIKMIIRKHIRK